MSEATTSRTRIAKRVPRWSKPATAALGRTAAGIAFHSASSPKGHRHRCSSEAHQPNQRRHQPHRRRSRAFASAVKTAIKSP